jgi:vanillate O-demethylase ferredoxin subunit
MSNLNEPMGRIDAIVIETSLLTADIKGIRLAAADSAVLPPADPGAHIDLWLPDGHVRQYSVIERAANGSAYVSMYRGRETTSRWTRATTRPS